MTFKDFFKSKMFKGILAGVGVFAIVLFVFQAGIFVGYRKAGFSYGWGDNYYRNFGGGQERGRGSMIGGIPPFGEYFPSSHGANGKIIKINLPNVIVLGLDGVEKVVLIKNDTSIRSFRETIKSTDLKIDDFIIVIGSPNDKSEVEAKLIRILPEPREMMRGAVLNETNTKQ